MHPFRFLDSNNIYTADRPEEKKRVLWQAGHVRPGTGSKNSCRGDFEKSLRKCHSPFSPAEHHRGVFGGYLELASRGRSSANNLGPVLGVRQHLPQYGKKNSSDAKNMSPWHAGHLRPGIVRENSCRGNFLKITEEIPLSIVLSRKSPGHIGWTLGSDFWRKFPRK